MSSALAVAGVTAVIRGMLESWLIGQNANAALGGANAEVSAIAPDAIDMTATDAQPRLNLFLHQVEPNAGWRNVDLPSTDARGRRAASPPLALDLHYLLTAYGVEELQAEVLLGYGMQLLHEVPVLDRATIDGRLPAALAGSRLGRQVEQIKITLEPMPSDELSRLWAALQAHYRPSAAYHVSVVLIERAAEGRAALPVLTRGPVEPATGLERGIVATTDLAPALPGITAVRPPDERPGALLGDVVTVDGHHLDGADRAVVIENRQLGVEREIGAAAGSESGQVRFTVPLAPAQLAVGTYALRVLVLRPGETDRRQSSRLALTILPDITTALPLAVARAGDGSATIALAVRPQVRPAQRVTLALGTREVPAEPHPTSTGTLSFVVPDAPVGSHLVAVRVDGFDSPIVDRTVTPPVFLDRRVVIS